MIIGLIGYAQSGKDTVAEIITTKYPFTRKAFADKIRDFLYDLNFDGMQFVIDSIGWERAKKLPSVRQSLQNLGVSARNHLGEDIWVSAVLKSLEPNKNYIITDVRFLNEVEAIKSVGGVLWRVHRPGVGPVNDHISELELKDYETDETLVNEGTLEELVLLVQTRMDSLLNAN